MNLKVVKGPHGSVLALVPVYIDGHGPFVFALDTGSSRSVITTSLAKHFHLKMVGQTGQISGVASTTHANLVKVNQWRVGSITLDARTVTSLSFPSNNGGGSKLQGLLGSDVLSQFSRVTIEYNKGVLILSR